MWRLYYADVIGHPQGMPLQATSYFLILTFYLKRLLNSCLLTPQLLLILYSLILASHSLTSEIIFQNESTWIRVYFLKGAYRLIFVSIL